MVRILRQGWQEPSRDGSLVFRGLVIRTAGIMALAMGRLAMAGDYDGRNFRKAMAQLAWLRVQNKVQRPLYLHTQEDDQRPLRVVIWGGVLDLYAIGRPCDVRVCVDVLELRGSVRQPFRTHLVDVIADIAPRTLRMSHQVPFSGIELIARSSQLASVESLTARLMIGKSFKTGKIPTHHGILRCVQNLSRAFCRARRVYVHLMCDRTASADVLLGAPPSWRYDQGKPALEDEEVAAALVDRMVNPEFVAIKRAEQAARFWYQVDEPTPRSVRLGLYWFNELDASYGRCVLNVHGMLSPEYPF